MFVEEILPIFILILYWLDLGSWLCCFCDFWCYLSMKGLAFFRMLGLQMMPNIKSMDFLIISFLSNLQVNALYTELGFPKSHRLIGNYWSGPFSKKLLRIRCQCVPFLLFLCHIASSCMNVWGSCLMILGWKTTWLSTHLDPKDGTIGSHLMIERFVGNGMEYLGREKYIIYKDVSVCIALSHNFTFFITPNLRAQYRTIDMNIIMVC